MKVISIGRENGCDIVLNDTTDVISRRHAILNIYPSGKMTITDQGHNGTYVNGIRITPNVPFPVTRNDTVSFAHVMQLDWNLVPNQRKRVVGISIIIVVVIVALIAAGIFLTGNGGMFRSHQVLADTTKVDTMRKDSSSVAKKDSTDKKKEVKETKTEKDKPKVEHKKSSKSSKKSEKKSEEKDKSKPAKQEAKPTKDNSKERIM